jgi:predicted ATPase
MSQLNQNTNLTSDQRLVIEDVLKADQMIRDIKAGTALEEGDLTWIASAIGRGLRLAKYLQQEIEESTLEILHRSKDEFLSQLEWSEQLILETDFQEILDELEVVFANSESTPLELMTMMIEIDRLVCALNLTNPVDDASILQQQALIEQVQVFSETYLEGSAKLADKAGHFIKNQGVEGHWAQVWQNFVQAQTKLDELDKIFREADELDTKQPMDAFDFFANLEDN